MSITNMTESQLFALEIEVRNSTIEQIKAMDVNFVFNLHSKSAHINIIKALRSSLLAA